jgi:hypothetical protein
VAKIGSLRASVKAELGSPALRSGLVGSSQQRCIAASGRCVDAHMSFRTDVRNVGRIRHKWQERAGSCG